MGTQPSTEEIKKIDEYNINQEQEALKEKNTTFLQKVDQLINEFYEKTSGAEIRNINTVELNNVSQGVISSPVSKIGYFNTEGEFVPGVTWEKTKAVTRYLVAESDFQSFKTNHQNASKGTLVLLYE